ncbi:hypothetical protein AAFN85_31300 [Mucilaginibacter sp. CAU 1740]|uniref:hypothetical protein n=1 Tax=Mucilaginibacter sp. CAU 1740 TaxID=3140365 RepID=UPI00325B88AA
MKKITLKLCITAVLALSISGCKKEKPLAIKSPQTSAAVPTPTFDYEHSDYMPTPAGTAPILVPWASGSNQLFNPEIAFDFKHADGWSLVYNTFNTTQLSPPYYFAL